MQQKADLDTFSILNGIQKETIQKKKSNKKLNKIHMRCADVTLVQFLILLKCQLNLKMYGCSLTS